MAIFYPWPASGEGINISVDAGKAIGPLPYIFRTGVFFAHAPEFPPDSPAGRRFFREQKIGAIEIQKPFLSPQLFPPGSTLEGYTERLANSDTVRWIKEIDRNGGEVIFNLMGVPTYLRTIQHDGHSRPYDYDKWADLVEATVDYINNKLHINAKYIVWDEPELFYGGTEADYLKLYKYSVIGAKRADRNAKIGGPASSRVMASFKGNKAPLLYDLIKYCSNTAVPEVGLKRLPIAFMVWHDFGSMTSARMKKDVSTVKQWLNEFSYPQDTELINGSWNSWIDFPSEGSVERDTEYLSAYVLPAVLAMDEAGIQRHLFFSLFENWQIREGESMYGQQILKKVKDRKSDFFGGFGLLTKNYIIKPVFNTFKALGMLEGNRLETRSNDPFISILASKSDEKMSLLFSNFIPDNKIAIREAANFLNEKGYGKDDLKKYGVSKKMFTDVIQGKVPVNNINIPEKAKRDLNVAIELADKMKDRRTNNVDVLINLANLHFTGDVKYERYIINSNSSNSYSVRNKIDAVISDAERLADQEANNYLSGIWSKEDIRKIQDMRGKGVKTKGFLEKVPSSKKKELNEAIKIREKILHEKIDEINEWQEVRLLKVEDKIIKVTGEYRESLVVQPNEVNLIILKKVN